MSEHAPKQEGREEPTKTFENPVTEAQFEAAVEDYVETQSETSHAVVRKWMNQEVQKRLETDTYEDLVRVHMKTAKTLLKMAMYKDAKDVLEGILIMAQDAGDEEVVGEALSALESIPTLH